MKPEREKENTTVAQTVVEKFEKLNTGGKAFVMGYLMGKEEQRRNNDEQKSA